MRRNRAGADDAIIANCYPRHDPGIHANMTIIADLHATEPVSLLEL